MVQSTFSVWTQVQRWRVSCGVLHGDGCAVHCCCDRCTIVQVASNNKKESKQHCLPDDRQAQSLVHVEPAKPGKKVRTGFICR